MRKMFSKKITAVILSVAVAFSFPAIAEPIEAEAASGQAQLRNVNLKQGNTITGINDPVQGQHVTYYDDNFDEWNGGLGCYVYFGSYYQEDTNKDGRADRNDTKLPIKWCVLDSYTSGIYNKNASMLLMTEKLMDFFQYNDVSEYTDPVNVCSDWDYCNLKKYLNSETIRPIYRDCVPEGFLKTAFSQLGQTAILFSDGNWGNDTNFRMTNMSIGNCKVFILSRDEVENEAYGFAGYTGMGMVRAFLDAYPTTYAFRQYHGYLNPVTGNEYRWWWLRSRLTGERDGVGIIMEDGEFAYVLSSDNTTYVRPCINLDLSKVVFTTAVTTDGKSAVNKTQAFAKVGSENAGKQWKLTMSGSASNSAPKVTSDKTSFSLLDGAQKLTISHKAANAVLSGATQTSAMLVDNNGTVICYGKAGSAGATTSNITMPTGLSAGQYKLYVFAEKVNNGLYEDYASALGTPITINVSKAKPTKNSVSFSLNATVYNGNQQYITVKPNAGVGTPTVYYEGVNGTSYSRTTTRPKNAGTYQVSVNFSEGADYLAAYNVYLGIWKIAPKTLTNIQLNSVDVAYQSDKTMLNQTMKISATGIVSGDSVSAVCSTVTRPSTGIAGEKTDGTAIVTKLTNGNYTFVPDNGQTTLTLKNQKYKVLAPVATPTPIVPVETKQPSATEKPNNPVETNTPEESAIPTKVPEVQRTETPQTPVEPDRTNVPEPTKTPEPTREPEPTKEPEQKMEESVPPAETSVPTQSVPTQEPVSDMTFYPLYPYVTPPVAADASVQKKEQKKTCTVNGIQYKVVSGGNLTVTGIKNKNKKEVVIPATVKIEGKTYRVTRIAQSALKNCKKLKKVTIGKYVTVIEKQAFQNCKSLKTIVIRSQKLKSVGGKSLSGIHKKAVIKIPKKSLKTYKKLLKGKGQAKTVTLKTY